MRNKQAFSLIEVLLATTILFVGVAVVMSSLSTSFTINILTEEQNKAITALNMQVEQIKSMPYCDDPDTGDEGTEANPEPGTLCHLFGSDFTHQIPFTADTVVDSNGQPAQGIIIPNIPVTPGDKTLLLEFTIKLPYQSDIAGPKEEETHIWISPYL